MMSLQKAMHSLQMKTFGPATILVTWLASFPQKLQLSTEGVLGGSGWAVLSGPSLVPPEESQFAEKSAEGGAVCGE